MTALYIAADNCLMEEATNFLLDQFTLEQGDRASLEELISTAFQNSLKDQKGSSSKSIALNMAISEVETKLTTGVIDYGYSRQQLFCKSHVSDCT